MITKHRYWMQKRATSISFNLLSRPSRNRDKVALGLRERVQTLYLLAKAQGPRGSLSCHMTTQSPCPCPHEVIHVSPNLDFPIPALIMWLDNWAHDYASPAMTPSLPSHGENFLWRYRADLLATSVSDALRYSHCSHKLWLPQLLGPFPKSDQHLFGTCDSLSLAPPSCNCYVSAKCP